MNHIAQRPSAITWMKWLENARKGNNDHLKGPDFEGCGDRARQRGNAVKHIRVIATRCAEKLHNSTHGLFRQLRVSLRMQAPVVRIQWWHLAQVVEPANRTKKHLKHLLQALGTRPKGEPWLVSRGSDYFRVYPPKLHDDSATQRPSQGRRTKARCEWHFCAKSVNAITKELVAEFADCTTCLGKAED